MILLRAEEAISEAARKRRKRLPAASEVGVVTQAQELLDRPRTPPRGKI